MIVRRLRQEKKNESAKVECRILKIIFTCHFLRTINFFNLSVGNATLLILSACWAIHGCSRHCLDDMRDLRREEISDIQINITYIFIL